MQHQPNPTNELNSSISQSLSSHIASNCLVTRARQVSRVLTVIYGDALRPFGIVAPQFSLLVLIAEWAPISRSELGRRSRHDRSTLTRNLRPLIVQGWVTEGAPAGDGRSRPLSLTAEGDALLRRAASAWSSAQSHATHALGNEGVDDFMNIARELALRAA